MLVMGKWKGNDPLTIPADQAHAMGTFKRLSNYTMLEINEKLKTYDKFIIVRHPLERLLSAYRNKFENKNEYFQSRFGKHIIKVQQFHSKYKCFIMQISTQKMLLCVLEVQIKCNASIPKNRRERNFSGIR